MTAPSDCRHLSEIFGEFSSPSINHHGDDMVGLFLLYASWNTDLSKPLAQDQKTTKPTGHAHAHHHNLEFLRDFDVELQDDDNIVIRSEAICVDQSDDEIDYLIDGTNSSSGRSDNTYSVPCPPEHLPCLLLLMKRPMFSSPFEARYLSKFTPDQIRRWIIQRNTISEEAATTTATNPPEEAKDELKMFLGDFGFLRTPTSLLREIAPTIQPTGDDNMYDGAIRIFIAGDRMSVGKTSVCLGLLGSLVQMGYRPDRLAYIKPATQNEKPQLVQHYCERMGIPCVGIGPIVYYRGFTRAYLAGETESSSELLQSASRAVDELAKDKDVVIVDGVGFPAVGSICGTDNASVAIASSYPRVEPVVDGTSTAGVVTGRNPMGVLVVGGPGVGGAVDAFNLNATYFEQANVPVLGAIFNKLALDGFYSLENCKEAISSYFAQNEHQIKHRRQPFGFVPLFPRLGGSDPMSHVFEYIRVFKDHVDVVSLLHSAHAIRQSYKNADDSTNGKHKTISADDIVRYQSSMKRQKVENGGRITRKFRSRYDIEQSAIMAGAAPSA